MSKDFYFTEDNYLVWPQPYNASFPHLPFIHYQQDEVDQNERSFLWSLPKGEDFQLNDQFCTGITSTSLPLFTSLQHNYSMYRVIHRNVWYVSSSNKSRDTTIKSKLYPFQISLNLHQQVPCVKLQQNVLETEALIDYLECQAHMIDMAETASMGQTINQNGTMNDTTNRINSANCFHCAPITLHCLSPAAVDKNPLVG